MNTLHVVVVEPGKQPREADIPDTSEAMREIVGGWIECVYWLKPFGYVIVCNDEGRLLNLTPNRLVINPGQWREWLVGNFFVAGMEGPEIVSLTPKDVQYVLKLLDTYFHTPPTGVTPPPP